MRPANLKTKIFLDGGNPDETRQTLDLLGFLDGQTTNPTLISKHPEAAQRLARGEKFSEEELLNFYKKVVQEISSLIPDGSISVEVYADEKTTSQQMFAQGKEMFDWIPNAHIKYPATTAGFAAAELSVQQDIRVNITLVFSQQQAAATYAATKAAKSITLPGFKNVFVSPFIGRLDDQGKNGMDLIKNTIKMYEDSNHHVEVLTASVRNLNHFLYALSLGTDIMTVPFKILKEWAEKGMPLPDENFVYNFGNLENIPYEQLDLNIDWQQFNISHPLTDAGIEKFSIDWNNLIRE